MLTKERGLAEIAELDARVAGAVVRPGDAGWDAARRAWNLAVDQRPEAVVFPADAADVVAVVELARAAGLGVAAQGTGHGAAARGSVEGTILLNMACLKGVEIDPVARTARVEAGVVWGDVSAAAAEHGLAGLAGSARDVGVVGYTLGGGLGWLARRHGLAANSVRAIEVVTADGEERRVDAGTDTELFWALRGGGGSFAVVTALELDLFPVSELYAGVIWWPFDRAEEVLARYLDWAETVPDELTSLVRVLHLPPLPFLPEEIRGKSFAVVEGAFLGSQAEGARLLRPLRELGGAAMDTFAMIPPTALGDLHQDPPEPVPGVGNGMVLGALPPEAVPALVGAAGPGTPVLSVELRHLGGALAASKPGHGALAAIDGRFAMYAVGIAPSPAAAAAVEMQLDRITWVLEPWATGSAFLNFSERPGAARATFAADTYGRLARVRAEYDPDGLIRANHPIEPAS